VEETRKQDNGVVVSLKGGEGKVKTIPTGTQGDKGWDKGLGRITGGARHEAKRRVCREEK